MFIYKWEMMSLMDDKCTYMGTEAALEQIFLNQSLKIREEKTRSILVQEQMREVDGYV